MSPSPEAARRAAVPSILCALILFQAMPIRETGPWAVLWAAPAILISAMLIAWGAESAQYFIAQGFALAILAWMQTLPEFAVEAVLAWRQQSPLLLANLTGALRLLTGIGWPMIYCTAAWAHRKSTGQPLKRILLEDVQAVEVVSLFVPLVYMARVYQKASLDLGDAAVLFAIYAFYLLILSRMPPKEDEGEELEAIPAAITGMRRWPRIVTITGLFIAGGVLIYYTAEPFLGSLLALATAAGLPTFLFIQWVAPFVSEFPEMVSTFYFARTVRGAPMALMNMVSSNINQWTLLAGMLPVVFSLSAGRPSSIPLDAQQRLELAMTLGQALVGVLFLINMELAWWEATVIFILFIVQFGFSAVAPGPGVIGFIATHIHFWTTVAYFVWAGIEVVRMVMGARRPLAFIQFAELWKARVIRTGPIPPIRR